ncbi:MAG: FAD-dependent oxidoreductase [Candidatus Cloacimonadota bacterium]|nr:FAD-dependent oxidoreductase [Candidatus Cloacimonadota bacterium]
MIKIKLNGKEFETTNDKTILDVANDNGIKIPTLCHDEELNPYGSCWVCAVKVKGRRGFVTSCGTKAMDGMEVETNSDDVLGARKMALELLLSDHYADCEAPCKTACPADIDIQSYLAYIANGQHQEAVRVIKDKLPMPLSIGRVCPAFCEDECRRQIVDESIAIRQLKRHAADADLASDWSYIPKKEEKKDKKVAIIGGGPSGLSCGFYLSTKGYEVKVFERSPEAGGWLMYGIPEYRLPKDILRKEIELMCANGMEIETNVDIGVDISLSQIQKDYDAVYLALGAQNAVPMRVKGSELKGSFLGVDFLKDIALGNKVDIGKKIAIIGGGNTAIDCARTSVRLGAEVTVIYRRTEKEMPAEEFEIEASYEEGIKFHFLTNPVEYFGKDGRINKIKLEKMELGEPDASGRRRPNPTGEFFEGNFDSVIAAISQKPDVDFLAEDENKIDGKSIKLTRWNTAEIDEDTMYTGMKNIFAGGDFQRGAATAVEAIGDAKIAADQIHKYLQGEDISKKPFIFKSVKADKVGDVSVEEYEIYEKIEKFKMPELDADIRKNNFEEVETGFAENDAKSEANRCLECGCQVGNNCALRDYSTEYEIDITPFKGAENKHPIDDSHPFILRDANKCIDCGRCIRTCAEIQGPGVLGYIYRGFDTYVAPDFGKDLALTTCESCGKCIEVCPVGALLERNADYKLSPQIGTETVQNCGICATGCSINVHSQLDKITFIDIPEEQGFNKRNVCFKGKFGWQAIETNKLEELTFDDKLIEIEKAGEIIKEEIGKAKSKAIFVSPAISNEEMLLMQEVGKKIGAKVVSQNFKSTFEDELLVNKIYSKDYSEIDDAENIVIVGDISQTARTLARTAQRNGAKLITISTSEVSLYDLSDIHFCDDDYSKVLDCLKIHNTAGEEKCDCDCSCHSHNETDDDSLSPKTIFLYNSNNIAETVMHKVWSVANKLCDFEKGSGVIAGSDWNNLNGFRLCGFEQAEITNTDFGMYYGEAIGKSKFSVGINCIADEIEGADLLIPAPNYFEMKGTAITDDYKLKQFNNVKDCVKFDRILSIMFKAGLISEEQKSTNYWLENIGDSLEKKADYSKLGKILKESNDLSSEIYIRFDAFQKRIGKSKKSIKK